MAKEALEFNNSSLISHMKQFNDPSAQCGHECTVATRMGVFVVLLLVRYFDALALLDGTSCGHVASKDIECSSVIAEVIDSLFSLS